MNEPTATPPAPLSPVTTTGSNRQNPAGSNRLPVPTVPNDFGYYILRAFCTEMGWKSGISGLFSGEKRIAEEVLAAQMDNAPADACYRVRSTTGPGASSDGSKWTWRTLEDLIGKADAKEKALLQNVFAKSNKLCSKGKAA